MTRTVAALCILVSAVCAAEPFYDPADDQPDDAVTVGESAYGRVAVAAGQTAFTLVEPRTLLPEFETAEFSVRMRVPSGFEPTGGEVEIRTWPGMLDGFNRGTLVRLPFESRFESEGDERVMSFTVSLVQIAESAGTEAFPSRMDKIRLFRTGGGSCEILVGRVDIVRKGLFADLTTGNGKLMVGDLDDPQRNAPRFVIRNAGPACAGEFIWKATFPDGQAAGSGSVSRSWEADETVIVDLPRPEKCTIIDVDCTIVRKGDGGFSHARHLAYGALRPTGAYPKLFTDEFLFSVCCHSLLYPMDEIRTMVDYLALAGCNHARNGVNGYWCYTEPERGQLRTARFDKVLALHTERNIECQGNLICPPGWAKHPEIRVGELGYPDLALYEEYCAREARRLKGRVRMFEDANEPDLADGWNAANFSDYEAAALRGIKAGNSEAALVGGNWGFSYNVSGHWAYDYYPTRAGTEADVYSFHYHGSYESSCFFVDRIRQILKTCGADRRWFANECAFSSPDGAAVPPVFMKKLVSAWANGSIGYTWYNLRNKGYYLEPKTGEVNFGLLTHDLCPRPAFLTLNMLCGVYRDARFRGDVRIADDVECRRFENGREALLPLWRLADRFGTSSAVLATDAERAEFIDLYGNAVPLEISDGRVRVTVSADPGTIRLTPAAATARCVSVTGSSAPILHAERGKEGGFDTRLEDMHYTSLVQGDPSKELLYWTGPADCAIWYVGATHPDCGRIRLRAAVADDRHCPAPDAESLREGDSVEFLFHIPGQKGLWRVGLALGEDGTVLKRVYGVPFGFDADALANALEGGVGPDSNGTLWYTLEIPGNACGVDLHRLATAGIRFNVVVNDNDGPCREGWMSLISGAEDDEGRFLIAEFDALPARPGDAELPWFMEGDVRRDPVSAAVRPSSAAVGGPVPDFAFGGPVEFSSDVPPGGVIIIR